MAVMSNRMPMPQGDMPSNPWGYDYWKHMHESAYYKPQPVDNPYCFSVNGEQARLKVDYYKQDPRWMRLSFENKSGEELFELSEYALNAYGEMDAMSDTAFYVPRYSCLCHDQYEGAPAGLFEQLQDRQICVPVYGPTGRISAKGNQYDMLLPEYVFDENALVQYDLEGMQKYDTKLAEFDAALQQWPGSTKTFACAVMCHVPDVLGHFPDKQMGYMHGWPKPDEYSGPGARKERPESYGDLYLNMELINNRTRESVNRAHQLEQNNHSKRLSVNVPSTASYMMDSPSDDLSSLLSTSPYEDFQQW